MAFIWEFVSFLWLVTELIGGSKKCISHGFGGTGGQTLGHLVGPGIAQGHWILGGLVPQMVDYSYLCWELEGLQGFGYKGSIDNGIALGSEEVSFFP